MKIDDRLSRIERKLDLVLRMQGLAVADIEQLVEAEDGDAVIEELTAKLKASADALKAATDAQPKQ